MSRLDTIQQIAAMLEQCDPDTLEAVYNAVRNIVGPDRKKTQNVFTFIARLL